MKTTTNGGNVFTAGAINDLDSVTSRHADSCILKWFGYNHSTFFPVKATIKQICIFIMTYPSPTKFI